MVNTNFSGHDDFAHALTLQSDGKIVVSGLLSNPSRGDFGIARYLTDGILDPQYGFTTAGVAIIDFFGSFDSAFDVAVQSDGRLWRWARQRTEWAAGWGLLELWPNVW